MDQNFLDMLARFESALQDIFEQPILELIIHGSVVDGGFVRGKGDIDFLVLVNHDITEAMFCSLKDYHRSVRSAACLENQLEGCYLVVDDQNRFMKKGVYIGTGEKGWKQFEGDIFSEIDKAYIHENHFEYKQSGLTKQLLTYDWASVHVALKTQIQQNVEMLDRYPDWNFRLHLLHTTARCLYTLKNETFASKTHALEWLAQKSKYALYVDYLQQIKHFKSPLTDDEILALNTMGHETLNEIILISTEV